ncbi:MAG: hypothetical protein V1836_00900 [Candidatus Aenigmatarchaeota archaeon]
MTITRKVTGVTMILAGFTFFAWFVALNTIFPAIPEGLQGTASFFMILSAVTGVGFLISGGMTFFGHDQYTQETAKKQANQPAAKDKEEKIEKSEEEEIQIGEPSGEKDNKKEGWQSPSKTGWG